MYSEPAGVKNAIIENILITKNVCLPKYEKAADFYPCIRAYLSSGCFSVYCAGDTENDSPAEAAEEGSGGAAGRRGERSHLVVWQVSLPTAPPRPHHLL